MLLDSTQGVHSQSCSLFISILTPLNLDFMPKTDLIFLHDHKYVITVSLGGNRYNELMDLSILTTR